MTRQDRSRTAKEAMVWRSYTYYMRGWDDALIDQGKQNPYNRSDSRDRWDKGRSDCLANKPLPYWYNDWKIRCEKGQP